MPVIIKNTFQRVLKNTFAQIAAQVIEIAASAILSIVAARQWGPEIFGNYSFIIAITTILLFTCDAGLNVLLIRNISREKEKNEQYLNTSLQITTILSSVSLFMVLLVCFLLKLDHNTIVGFLFGFLYVIVGVFISLFRGVFIAFEIMEYETLGKLIERSLALILGVLVLYSDLKIVEFFIVLCVSRLISLSYYYWMYCSKVNIRYKFHWHIDYVFSKYLLNEVWPFGINIILTSVYLQNGIVFLTLYSGQKETGYFRAILNILLPISIAIESMNTAFMPNLARWYINAKEKIVFLVGKVSALIFVITVPVSLILFIYPSEIISLIYGSDYIEAAVIIKIIAFSIVFRILKNIYAVVLTSINRQKERAVSVGIGTILSILLNFLLIKKYSYVGAAVASVLGEIFIFAGVYYSLSQYLPFKLFPSLLRWRRS